MRLGRAAIAATLALTAVFGARATAAEVGGLDFGDCLSGDTATAACESVDGATADGQSSGLASVRGVEISPDGRSLYAVSSGDDAIAHFQRDRRTGSLDYRGCLSGEIASAAACDQVQGAAADGEGSGLDGARSLALSPDGRSLYVGAGTDDAVSHLRRNTKTGALRFVGCVSGNSNASACNKLATATPNGNDSGLSGIDSVVVSFDGSSVYGAAGNADVATLRRAKDGALTYAGCISADADAPCEKLPGAVPDGSDTGFSSLRAVALSPDGRSLYTVSDSDEAIGEFRRKRSTGALSFRRCLTGATAITNCTAIPGATPNGDATGMRSTVHVTVSPDGNSVYTIADDDNAIAHFKRGSSGSLSFRGCLSGDINASGCTPVPGAAPSGGSNSGMNAAVWGEVAPDGRSVYVAASSDSAVNSFRRNPRSGALTALGCLSSEAEATPCRKLPAAVPGGENTGLYRVRSLTAYPDGGSLYAAASSDAAVARFDREPDTVGPKLKLKAPKRQRGRKVVVSATCRDELCTKLVGKGTLKAHGGRAKLKRATETDVVAGKKTKLKLRLSGRAKDALRAAGRGTVKVQIAGRDLLGNRAKRITRVALRR